MIGVFVSDQDSVEVCKVGSDSGQPGQGFAFPKASVDKDAGVFSFEQRQIAGTAGRKNGDAQAD